MSKKITARVLVIFLCAFACFSAFLPGVYASAAYDSWNAIVDDMSAVADSAYELYLSGDTEGAKAEVDVAYFSYYEKLGFEKVVKTTVSGSRAATVEYQFSTIKKSMTKGASNEEVKAALDELVSLLRDDANNLDGVPSGSSGGGSDANAALDKLKAALGDDISDEVLVALNELAASIDNQTAGTGGNASSESQTSGALTVFMMSFLLITREGVEAILIVGAIIAYLIKSGNKERTRAVYIGSVIALGASVVMAVILTAVLGASSGQNQEIIEGVTMFVAVIVLFYVSNWMVSKAEAAAWTTYIEGKVQSSISRGSTFSLAFAAFLAVFREGAEVILFYQAMIPQYQTQSNMLWAGLAVGCVGLVIIYILIRVLSLRLPLKPFFLGTSILLAVMSVTFVGSGVMELHEGGIIGATLVPGLLPANSVDILGFYPYFETLIPQVILLLITITAFVLQIRNWRKSRNVQAAAAISKAAPSEISRDEVSDT
jgi:high-affinity iron transporter